MSAAPQRDLGAGATIGERYVVRGVLGEGGMGQVVRVEHLALGRPFALKMLRLEKWNDELVRRFNREARALARITTPRVAQITDFGVDADVGPFYVMELVDGQTLEQRIEQEHRLRPAQALAICAELCDALAEVHGAGIVHRDLKPSNVGLPASGPVGVKLLDFGLAAAIDDAFLSKITQSQQILGSLPYMAPEQFNAASPTPAMDVYALGVVLFEALTGKLPFHAPSTAALIHQILAAPVPPLPSGLPGILPPLLERLLAKAPGERFASAAAAGQAIREVAAALERPDAPPTRASPESSVPKTSEGRADVGLLPTLGTTTTPTPWAPPSESGMRLHAGAQAPTAPHPPPQAASAWRRRLIVLGVLGVAFGGLAAIASVFALTAWSRRGAAPTPALTTPAEAAADPVMAPPAPRPLAGAPVDGSEHDAVENETTAHETADSAAEPAAPQRPTAEEESAERTAAQRPTAEEESAERTAAQRPTAEEETAEPAAADVAAEPDAVPIQPNHTTERRNPTPRARGPRPSPESIEARPLPSAPEAPPSPARGSSPSSGGIIRQW